MGAIIDWFLKGQDMSHKQFSIRTRDGDCPAHVFKPDGLGAWPAAIFYMDGLGIRPTLFERGQRLADGGYVVLLPDLFYRAGPYAALDPKKVLASGDVMGVIGHLFRSTNNRLAAERPRSQPFKRSSPLAW
jgi:carboxymethylenebutenolidase